MRGFENPEDPGPVLAGQRLAGFQFAACVHVFDRAVDLRRGAGDHEAAGWERADAIGFEVEIGDRARVEILAVVFDEIELPVQIAQRIRPAEIDRGNGTIPRALDRRLEYDARAWRIRLA